MLSAFAAAAARATRPSSRKCTQAAEVERPQDANFTGWTEALINVLCDGGANNELRKYPKNTAKKIGSSETASRSLSGLPVS